MPPPFTIENVENTGPADNSGDDSLWVACLSEPGGKQQRFRFCVLLRYGVPSPDELRAMIEQRASGFANDTSAVDQFRECEVPHPEDSPWRRVVWLTPPRALA